MDAEVGHRCSETQTLVMLDDINVYSDTELKDKSNMTFRVLTDIIKDDGFCKDLTTVKFAGIVHFLTAAFKDPSSVSLTKLFKELRANGNELFGKLRSEEAASLDPEIVSDMVIKTEDGTFDQLFNIPTNSYFASEDLDDGNTGEQGGASEACEAESNLKDQASLAVRSDWASVENCIHNGATVGQQISPESSIEEFGHVQETIHQNPETFKVKEECMIEDESYQHESNGDSYNEPPWNNSMEDPQRLPEYRAIVKITSGGNLPVLYTVGGTRSKKKLPMCTICGRKFHNSSNLNRHMRLHTGEKPFQCTSCGKRFSDQGNLQTHRVVHSDERPFLCTICGRKFRWKNVLERHMATHTKDLPYICHVCGFTCTERATFSRHMCEHSDTSAEPSDSSIGVISGREHLSVLDESRTGEKKVPECMVCGRKFHNSSNLTRHMRLHTGEKPYQCATCGKRFSDQGNLQSHKVVHSGEKPYVCTICGKRFRWKNILKGHLTTHTGERPYVCHICGFTCTRRPYLVRHMFKHSETRTETSDNSVGEMPVKTDPSSFHELNDTGSKKKLPECKVCGRKYHNPSNLRRHMRLHTGEKPYQCSVCGKRFSDQGNLQNHIVVHSGEKPYVCTVCGNRFKWKNVLEHHMLTHTKEKPHMCHVCGWSCTRLGALKDHMAKHTGEYPYTCTVCGKGFNRARSLDSHMSRHTDEGSWSEECINDMTSDTNDNEALSGGSNSSGAGLPDSSPGHIFQQNLSHNGLEGNVCKTEK